MADKVNDMPFEDEFVDAGDDNVRIDPGEFQAQYKVQISDGGDHKRTMTFTYPDTVSQNDYPGRTQILAAYAPLLEHGWLKAQTYTATRVSAARFVSTTGII